MRQTPLGSFSQPWRGWMWRSGRWRSSVEVGGRSVFVSVTAAQPFTPEEAMELMKERWKAMNKIKMGTVIMDA